MDKNKYRYFNKYYWIRKFSTSSFSKLLVPKKLLRKITFNSIYKSNYWRDYNKPTATESYSGKGSDLKTCNKLIKNLQDFIIYNKVNTILDLACGDFLWMRLVINNISEFKKYHGIDIVDDLVKKNIKLYSNENINFSNQDIIEINIDESYDLVIARDLFIHLDNKNIIKTIKKIKNSNAKFFAVSTTPEIKINKNLKSQGRYRAINFEIPTFELKNPYKSFDDAFKDGMNDFINIYEVNKIII